MTSIRRTRSLFQLPIIHILVLSIYFLGIAFSFSTLLLNYGYGLSTYISCRAAILLCLVFYLGQKMMLYVFLVERTHTARAATRSRRKDWVYLTGLVLVLVGCSTIAITTFVWNVSDYSAESGICRIGLPYVIAVALLTFDVCVNFFLTLVFLYYVRPYLIKGMMKIFVPGGILSLLHANGLDRIARTRNASITVSQTKLERVIRKTFGSCLGVLASTIANLTILIVYSGREQSWMCFTFCTIDVTWAVIIIHWLTASADEPSQDTTHETTLRTVSSPQNMAYIPGPVTINLISQIRRESVDYIPSTVSTLDISSLTVCPDTEQYDDGKAESAGFFPQKEELRVLKSRTF